MFRHIFAPRNIPFDLNQPPHAARSFQGFLGSLPRSDPPEAPEEAVGTKKSGKGWGLPWDGEQRAGADRGKI